MVTSRFVIDRVCRIRTQLDFELRVQMSLLGYVFKSYGDSTLRYGCVNFVSTRIRLTATQVKWLI